MKARVTVMLKTGVLDPQGEAVRHALGSLGFPGVQGVRQGKVIELDLPRPTARRQSGREGDVRQASRQHRDRKLPGRASVTDGGPTPTLPLRLCSFPKYSRRRLAVFPRTTVARCDITRVGWRTAHLPSGKPVSQIPSRAAAPSDAPPAPGPSPPPPETGTPAPDAPASACPPASQTPPPTDPRPA